ncbi:hypothetical protein EX30DRAFT_311543, partial [Ascodesmis nigricans]
VFVLHSEETPHEPSQDLNKGDHETQQRRVLDPVCEYEEKEPVAADEGVDDHGEVVQPGGFEAEVVAKEGVFGVWVQERPVHDDIPNGCSKSASQTSTEDEGCFGGMVGIDTPDTQRHVMQYREGIFPAIGHMGKPHFGVMITSETLKETPDPW